MSPHWKVSTPTFADTLRHAWSKGLWGGSLATVLLVIVRSLLGLVSHAPDPGKGLFPPLPEFLGGMLQAWLILFGCFFVGGLLTSSRTLQDRAFTLAGLLATGFGLGVLVVFFTMLALEVRQWFRVTPDLVERQNAALTAKVRDAQALIDAKMDDLKKELAQELANAATPEEKKEVQELFDTDILPRTLKDLELTRKESEIAATLGVREDVSAWGVLWFFLTHGPSNQPQDAGIYPALLGSLMLGILTLICAVPVGVGAALYLEEYRSNTWLARVIQVNINNLAGVPSVVYGILGAAVFVRMFLALERMYPGEIAARNVLGGGLTLALLTLPVVIVAAQEAIRAVPKTLREGAYALGATRWQVMRGVVLPQALPGIFTGTILALSRALGEAAPLVLFGALLFVNQNPTLFSRFTVLPMQIFGWADRPPIVVEGVTVDIWKYNAALASLILLGVLLTLNAFAIYFRNRAQRSMRV